MNNSNANNKRDIAMCLHINTGYIHILHAEVIGHNKQMIPDRSPSHNYI